MRLGLALLLAAAALPGAAGAQRLVWIDTYYNAPAIRELNLDGSGYASFPLGAGSLPEALALDAHAEQLYFADAAWNAAAIHRANGDLGGIASVVAGQKCMLGLAVNPSNGRMYWTTTVGPSGPAIMSANLDGSGVALVLSLGAASVPRAIAVDATRGRLYVADFGQRAILACNLDGSAFGALAAFGAPARPWGAVVDPAANLVYWSDYATGQIFRVPAPGGAITTVQSGLNNPTDLALDPAAGTIYWAEAVRGGQRIARSPAAGGAVTPVTSALSAYGGLAIDPARRTAVPPGDAPITAVAFGPARPSPSRGAGALELALPRPARVTLVVTDVQGRAVATLREGAEPAGRQVIAWDARLSGRPAAPGVYFARLRTGSGEWVRRIVLAR
jgi:hypothetical protein